MAARLGRPSLRWRRLYEDRIFLFDGVTALDVVGPFESLVRLANAEIVFAAKAHGQVRTGDGFLGLHADVGLADVHSADVVIVPGGHPNGLRRIMTDPVTCAWLRQLDRTAQWTCSVCTGALILGAARLLQGRRTSTHWRAKDHLQRFGAIFSSERVTRDGKYLTSAGVSAGIDMGLSLCGDLAGLAVAEAIELSMQYDPQPPFKTGNPQTSVTEERLKIIEQVLRS